MVPIKIVEYVDSNGALSVWQMVRRPRFSAAAAKMTVSLARLEQGNLSNAKSVGGGLLEYRIDFGPGYRLYFGRDGEGIVVLLAGGRKKRQQQDIAVALARWQDYRRRKKEGLFQ